MRLRLASAGLALALASSLPACSPPDAPALRDAYPTTLHRGDVLTIEASRPIFTVGAPTTVALTDVDDRGLPLRFAGHAVDERHVLAEITGEVERLVGGRHRARTRLSVLQVVGGGSRSFASADGAPFELSLFPPDATGLARRAADAVAEHARLWRWLGLELREERGALWVSGVQHAFDKRALLARYDVAPKDGHITKAEARIDHPDGLSYNDAWHLDANHDGTIDGGELDRAVAEPPPAARAGVVFGDYVVSADGRPVATWDELASAWDERRDEPVLLLVRRTVSGIASERTLAIARAGSPARLWPEVTMAAVALVTATAGALPFIVMTMLLLYLRRRRARPQEARGEALRSTWSEAFGDGGDAGRPAALAALLAATMLLPVVPGLAIADLDVGLALLIALLLLSMLLPAIARARRRERGADDALRGLAAEAPSLLALLPVAALAGTLSLERVVRAAGGAPWSWHLFRDPFVLAAGGCALVAAALRTDAAEGGEPRATFAPALRELVLATTFALVFLGGWRLPLVGATREAATATLQLAGLVVVAGKVALVLLAQAALRRWLARGVLPTRLRPDAARLLLAALACLVGELVVLWVPLPREARFLRPLWFGIGVLVALAPVGLAVARRRRQRRAEAG